MSETRLRTPGETVNEGRPPIEMEQAKNTPIVSSGALQTRSATVRGRTISAQSAFTALVALGVVSAAFRALIVGFVHGPFIFMDELGYERMAQSFAHTGHLSLFGKSGLAYSPFYPIVLSPIYALTDSMHTAYEWAKVANAVLISLSVFPIYAVARFVLPRGRALGVAALSLLAPLMLYSSFEMSESLAYPLFFVALWAMLHAVRRPSVRNDAVLVAAIILASTARLQQVALFPAALTAIVLLAFVRPEPPRGRLAAVRGAISRHRLLFGLFAATLVAVLGRTAINGGNLPLAGRYANVGSAHAGPFRVIELFVQHLAELDWAVGVVPFAAALLAAYALVRFGFPRSALVFASVALASTFWLLLEVAFDAAAFDPTRPERNRLGLLDYPRIHERYLIYLMPLFLVALLAAFSIRRERLPGNRHLAAAAAAAAFPVLIPIRAVIGGPTTLESFSLLIFGRKVSGHTVPAMHATTLVLVLSALLAAIYLLAATRRLPPAAAVLITALAFVCLSTLELGSQLKPFAQAQLGIPAQRNWVDRVVGHNANVSLVEGSGGRDVALRETAFWNESITRIYYTCSMAFGPDFGEQALTPNREGVLRGRHGAVRTRYAVVPAKLDVAGRVLARDRLGGLVLVAPTGPLRVPSGRRAAATCATT